MDGVKTVRVLLLTAVLLIRGFPGVDSCTIEFGIDAVDIRAIEEPPPEDLSFTALLYHSNLTYSDILDDKGTFQGDCLPYKSCPSWVVLSSRVPSSYLKLLRNVYCGQKHRNSLYCCPRLAAGTRALANATASTVLPPSSTTIHHSRYFSVGDPNNQWSRHQNRKLLPGTRYGDCGRDKNSKIVSGVDAELGQYPWNVRLGYLDASNARAPVDFKCGGSLINNRYVVTAAHCVKDKKLILKTVRLGEHDVRRDPDCSVENGNSVCASPVIDISVNETNIIGHPEYNATNYRNDIALIRLPEPVKFTEWVQPVCLPFKEVLRKPRGEVRVTVTGWGLTNAFTGTDANILQQIDLPLHDFEECRRFFGTLRRPIPISEQYQLCLGNGTGDSCRGDSGGPAMVIGDLTENPKFYLVGVVSFGPNRCSSPGVYTLVSSYLKWILDNVRS